MLGFWVGMLVGILPLIIFEVRHNFYNTQTAIILFFNIKEVIFGQGVLGKFQLHYFLNISFFVILIILWRLRNSIKRLLVPIFVLLLSLSLWIYLPYPENVYGMPSHWNYLDELKAHQIIVSNPISGANFNVTNLIYDPKAEVQKYLLREDNIMIKFDDYKSNQYLYILTDKKNIFIDQADEMSSFRSARIIQRWRINPYYDVILIKR